MEQGLWAALRLSVSSLQFISGCSKYAFFCKGVASQFQTTSQIHRLAKGTTKSQQIYSSIPVEVEGLRLLVQLAGQAHSHHDWMAFLYTEQKKKGTAARAQKAELHRIIFKVNLRYQELPTQTRPIKEPAQGRSQKDELGIGPELYSGSMLSPYLVPICLLPLNVSKDETSFKHQDGLMGKGMRC